MLCNKLKLFTHIYKNNNKIIGSISFKNLMNEYIITPNIQRIKDDKKITDIVNYQSNYFKKDNNQCFNFQGLINIHCCEEDGNNYLVDGQHRYFSIKNLMNIYGDSHLIDIECIKVKTFDDLNENYKLINKNTPLPEFKSYNNKNIVEEVSKYFFDTYPDIWKPSRRPQRPYINKNHFQESIEYLYIKLDLYFKNSDKNVHSKYLIDIIDNKNKKMKQWPLESYEKNIRKIKKWPEYKEIADSKGFYLGMYSNISQDYCYMWIKEIIKEETGEELKNKRNTNKKKSIPKAIKEETWNKWVGETHGIALCYCCRKAKISKSKFVAGHVVAEANGGVISVDNLRPICQDCNSSMMTKHMLDYIKEFYPNNTNLFENNKPPLINKKEEKKEKKSRGFFGSIFPSSS